MKSSFIKPSRYGLPSPFLERLNPETSQKLTEFSYKKVAAKVRDAIRKNSPANCSQNLLAENPDLDRALELTRQKERNFDKSIKLELSKLHINKEPKLTENSEIVKPSLKIKIIIQEKNTEPSQEKKPIEMPKLKTRLIKEKIKRKKTCSPRANTSFRTDLLTSYLATARHTSMDMTESLPPLIKSTPIHMDPYFKFPKKTSSNESSPRLVEKHGRLNSLDAIMNDCIEFKPTLKPDYEEILRTQKERDDDSKGFLNYVNDLGDILRMAHDERSFNNMMSTRNYNKKLDKNLKNDSNEIQDDMSMVMQKIIDLGGHKVWRLNHTSFMARADKEINSFSRVKPE
ncbi:unnamed protein product [Blepharisma stoltei]|uniref:Uncharacterized protein n=1 Tax=Blepharisma stoltei TaxID=1481888 RepID=A0AAU9JWQ4_9CILI|nr:unnamed protein product [Blepharisma stoltei]